MKECLSILGNTRLEKMTEIKNKRMLDFVLKMHQTYILVADFDFTVYVICMQTLEHEEHKLPFGICNLN